MSTTPLSYTEGQVKLHISLTSITDGGEWSASHSDRFTYEERALGTQ